MTKHNTVTTWEDLTDYDQINLYWEYLAGCGEEEFVTFDEFDEMMTGVTIA